MRDEEAILRVSVPIEPRGQLLHADVVLLQARDKPRSVVLPAVARQYDVDNLPDRAARIPSNAVEGNDVGHGSRVVAVVFVEAKLVVTDLVQKLHIEALQIVML